MLTSVTPSVFPRRRRRAIRLVVAAALLSFGLAACGSDDAGDGLALDQSVFDTTAQTVQGETFDLNELAGQDLIVWFWAPW